MNNSLATIATIVVPQLIGALIGYPIGIGIASYLYNHYNQPPSQSNPPMVSVYTNDSQTPSQSTPQTVLVYTNDCSVCHGYHGYHKAPTDLATYIANSVTTNSSPVIPCPEKTIYAVLVSTNLVSQPCPCGFCDNARGIRVPEHINQIGYDLRFEVSTNYLPVIYLP